MNNYANVLLLPVKITSIALFATQKDKLVLNAQIPFMLLLIVFAIKDIFMITIPNPVLDAISLIAKFVLIMEKHVNNSKVQETRFLLDILS